MLRPHHLLFPLCGRIAAVAAVLLALWSACWAVSSSDPPAAYVAPGSHWGFRPLPAPAIWSVPTTRHHPFELPRLPRSQLTGSSFSKHAASHGAALPGSPGAGPEGLREALLAGVVAAVQMGEQGWRAVAGLAQQYCAPQRFADVFRHYPLEGYLPCFEETAIVNPVHMTTIAFLFYRLSKIRAELRKGVKQALYVSGPVRVVQLLACLTNAVVPLAVLAMKVHARTIVPFEVTGLLLGACTWGLMTLVVDMEHEVCFPHGYWMYRFLWLLSFVTAAVQAKTTHALATLTMVPHALQLASLSVLAFLALFHWPRCHKTAESEPLKDSVAVDAKPGPPPCPQYTTSWLSRITWGWVNPLINTGYRRPLTEDDVWQVPDHLGARVAHREFSAVWQEELRRPKPSLAHALWKAFGGPYRAAGYWKLLNDAGQFAGPVLLGTLVAFVKGNGPAWQGYAIAAAIFLGQYLGAVGENQYFDAVLGTGLRVQGAVSTEVYQKSLKLSQQSRAEQTTGKMTNILSTDTDQLQKVCQQLHILWSSPLRIIISLYFLYRSLGGPAALAGLAALCVFIPVQLKLAKRLGNCTQLAFQQADQRISLTNEILAGIRIIKSYVWEKAFSARVQQRREKELVWVRSAAMARAFLNLNITLAPLTMAVVSFTVFVALGGALTPEVAFTSIALFNVIKLPLFFFPAVIQVVIEAGVSYRRIKEFLMLPEATPQLGTRPERGLAVQVRHATFGWTEGSADLESLTFSVPRGDLVCVVGETGSGKSSVLMALLGEMPRRAGQIHLRGKVAFVSQQPWIFKGTIRENILFGKPYDSHRYTETLQVCQLMRDLETFAAGDQQEVGEQGVGLSGGQKQRLSLARAVYADADVFLFDDSLSALDARVGRALFNECIVGYLGRKTRLLVCNQLHFVPQADKVLVMKDGRIVEQGACNELLARNGEFALMMQKYGGLESWLEEDDDGKAAIDSGDTTTIDVTPTSPDCPQIVADISSIQYPCSDPGKGEGDASAIEVLSHEFKDDGSLELTPLVDIDEEEEEPEVAMPLPRVAPYVPPVPPARSRMISEETRASGTTLTAKNIMGYIRALGGITVLLQAGFVLALLETCRMGNVFWLSWWSQSRWQLPARTWLGVYALWAIGQSLCSLLNLSFLADRGVVAARKMHDTMLDRIMRAPVLFFDSTPIGRIVNRFSRDQRSVDTVILPTLGLCLTVIANLVSTVVLIGMNTPNTLVILVPISFAFMQIQAQYRRAAREIKRMESTSRSPIYSHYGETLSGIATVRAFGAEQHMEETNVHHLLEYQRFQWASFALNRWLSMKLEFLGGVVILAAGCFAILQRRQLGAALLGLTLSQTFSVTAMLGLLNRLLADLETAFTSVERIIEYEEVEQERLQGSVTPPADWPPQGCITFHDVEMRYRPDVPPSLKEVTFQIKPAEKVGIVGRTGAGKSSLLVAMYRLSELSAGKIYIDGVDISTVDLHRLRRAISIIPQTPILFTGPIRDNLDPFNERTDGEIWDALGHAKLKDVIEELPGQLAFNVTEGGDSFSVGQRQLLCLARALLRRSKILMIDEATANIDTLTDNMIQETIRTQFQDCTTITIAHRLNTIIDSDRVLVLNYGWMVQFDTPAKLLRVPYSQPSIFRDLVNETGEASANYLRSVAFSRDAWLTGPTVSMDSIPVPPPGEEESGGEEDPTHLPVDAQDVLAHFFASDPDAPFLPAERAAAWARHHLPLAPERQAEFLAAAHALAAADSSAPGAGPRGRLAFILLADQILPRLGLPDGELERLRAKAGGIAKDMVLSGEANGLQLFERLFVFLAYQRSEDPADLQRCLDLLEGLKVEVEALGPDGEPLRRYIGDVAHALRAEVAALSSRSA
eukprot:EG_transcript_143